ncbi:MAG: hypothetical protein IJY20_08620 [Clostridia bacterium]|nr:hypothetical protein [Clostridia bacterium]
MKKTLLGVLAFLLVLATVLTGTVFAAEGDAPTTANVGKVKRLADDADPIKVDGHMDEAYKDAVPLLINSRPTTMEGIYTYGFARFVWSKAENAIYCYVLINDAEVNQRGDNPWTADSVEMFLALNGKNTQEWGIDGLKGDGVLNRGLQYRIDGMEGYPTCLLEEEWHASASDNAVQNTYFFNEELGRLENAEGNKLINETTNIFGWKYYGENATNNGWGWGAHSDGKGYAVEFRIEASGQKVTLADGQTILFDFQVNDRFGVDANGKGQAQTFYYTSTYREAQGAGTGNSLTYYDSLTISDETVPNKAANVITEQELTKYGKGDPEVEYTKPKSEAERTYTDKVTVNRVSATRVTGVATSSSTSTKKDDPTTTTTAAPKGGCGSSIAIGTSVAMIALVGATGFFAFRRKDEE